MQISFSPPDISQKEIDAVVETLKSGWITTGAKSQLLAQRVKNYCATDYGFTVSSATSGLFLALTYFGIKKGDEVITTPYTYAATAHVIEHCGATIVLVDTCENDFNINPELLAKAITPRTKAVISVDFAGLPVAFNEIHHILEEKKALFNPENDNQKRCGRPFFLSDSAHSFGSYYKGKRVGHGADVCVFSFQAVKNLTTAEGGALVFNNTPAFDGQDFYDWLSLWSIQGQTKTAYDKNQKGNWFYDIKVPGFNLNLPDILAAIGLSQLERYEEMLSHRFKIWDIYTKHLKDCSQIILPILEDENRKSNAHLFPIRVKDEKKRDFVIQQLAKKGIATNVHFIPIPLHSYYKNRFNIHNTPVAYRNYLREISIPIYSTLKENEAFYTAQELITALS